MIKTSFVVGIGLACGSGLGPAIATSLKSGTYAIPSQLQQQNQCDYYSSGLITDSDGNNGDATFYFAGMGKKGSTMQFPAYLQGTYGNGGANPPWAEGVVSINLPVAPASDISNWSGDATVTYTIYSGIQGLTKAVFTKQSTTFAATISALTPQVSIITFQATFADGCQFAFGWPAAMRFSGSP